MAPPPNPVWAEAVQLVPIIVLASSFIVGGEVDLARAGSLFAVAAFLTVPASAAVVWRGHLLNPILVGTALWLWAGGIAFNVPVPSLAAAIAETQAVGLFVAALAVGGVTTFGSAGGYIGYPHPDPGWVRRASVGLLVLTVAVVAWCWVWRHDIRIGGGLPFIVLNVARRIGIARGSAASP